MSRGWCHPKTGQARDHGRAGRCPRKWPKARFSQELTTRPGWSGNTRNPGAQMASWINGYDSPARAVIPPPAAPPIPPTNGTGEAHLPPEHALAINYPGSLFVRTENACLNAPSPLQDNHAVCWLPDPQYGVRSYGYLCSDRAKAPEPQQCQHLSRFSSPADLSSSHDRPYQGDTTW